MHPLVSRTLVLLLAIHFLNEHANSAWMISSSSTAITPRTCFIDKTYLPSAWTIIHYFKGHAHIFPGSCLCSFVYLSFMWACKCSHSIPLRRYTPRFSNVFVSYQGFLYQYPRCAGFSPKGGCVVAQVNCYPQQDMSTAKHRFRL